MTLARNQEPRRMATRHSTRRLQSASATQPGGGQRVTKSPKPANTRTSKARVVPSRPVATTVGTKQSDVLLAIKPVHLGNIVCRQKNHEYRSYRLRDGVERLWLYETADGGRGKAAITHVAVIPSAVRHLPGSVPVEPFGIDNAEFNASLGKTEYGYPVLELYELVQPVTLAEMKSRWDLRAPMGWRYVREDLWEDRWGGEDKDEVERVRRVF